MKEQFTISIFTENRIGLLNRVTIIFTRRHINIESITASESETHGVYRYTIVVTETETQVAKVVKQIDKQIEIFKAFYHRTEDILYQEIALYKLPSSVVTDGLGLEKLVRDNHARILTVEKDFLIIEKTGHKEETESLLEQLRPFGLLEFVRSGRVAIIKEHKEFLDSLHHLENNKTNKFEGAVNG